MRRPAFFTAAWFALGLWSASALHPPHGLLLTLHAGILAAAALSVRFGRSDHPPTQALMALAICSAGIIRYGWEVQTGGRRPCFDGDAHFTGVVVDEPFDRDDLTHATLRLESQRCDSLDIALGGSILLRIRGAGSDIRYGDRMTFPGVLHAPRPPSNPGAFDSRAYAEYRGISGTIFLPDTVGVQLLRRDEGHPLISGVVLPVRRAVRQAIERDLSGPSAALLKGILLGDRQAFPQGLLNDFSVTGLTHTLAVSGFNVGIVALVGFTLLRALSFRRLPAAGGVMLLLTLYAFVTGLSPSVVRATVMACALITGAVIERDTDALNTLGLAAVVLLTVWPLSLFDPGFQLSFMATLALIVLSRPLLNLFPNRPPRRRWRTWLWPPVAASLAAQTGSLPVVAYHFQTLSIVSFVANLPTAPLVSAATVLGVMTAMVGPFLPALSKLINATNDLLLRALLLTVHFFARWPCASVSVPRPSSLTLGVYYLAVGLALPDIRRSRWGRCCLFALLGLANAMAWQGLSAPGPGLDLVFLDVGQGDSAFIQFPDGKTMLVDGGMRAERFDAGRQVVLPFLRYRGIRRIDIVVASHPHDDHIGGLVEVLSQVSVGHYVDGGQASTSRASAEIRALIAQKKIPCHTVTAGDSLIGLGGVGGLVLHPGPAFVSQDTARLRGMNLNDGSVVLRLTYRNTTVLLTGDAEKRAEAGLRQWGGRLKGDLLKVGHHGSRTSSTPDFLAAVSPSVAVISVGERNRFGHPSPEVIERYRSSGIRVFRTDRTGAVIARVDNRGLQVTALLK